MISQVVHWLLISLLSYVIGIPITGTLVALFWRRKEQPDMGAYMLMWPGFLVYLVVMAFYDAWVSFCAFFTNHAVKSATKPRGRISKAASKLRT